MDYLKEISDAIDASNRSFEEFKRKNDARWLAFENAEAKSRRPHFGAGPLDDHSQPAIEHKSAFRNFLCKGDTAGLADLQVKALSVGSGTDGGFAVPKVIDGMIESLSQDISPIRAISQVVQISTQDYHKLVNERGLASGWVSETQARPETASPKFADISPPMGELYANTMATQQMLDDAFFNAESWLAEQCAVEFARAEGQAFISGTGVNQPMGFLSNPTAAIPDSSRAFGTLEYYATGNSGAFDTTSSTVNPSDDLLTLVSKLKAEYRRDAVWVMNKKTLFQVMAMKDSVGRYIFNPSSAPGMPDTILGYPVYEAEDMPDYTTANAYAIAFGNFKRGYIIADRIGTRVIRDPFSNKPYVGFYVTKRLGGSVLNSECIKLLKFGTS